MVGGRVPFFAERRGRRSLQPVDFSAVLIVGTVKIVPYIHAIKLQFTLQGTGLPVPFVGLLTEVDGQCTNVKKMSLRGAERRGNLRWQTFLRR